MTPTAWIGYVHLRLTRSVFGWWVGCRTGKTAAFAIAALTACDPKRKLTQALIIAPTQEIVEGHVAVITKLAKDTGVEVQGYFGLGKRGDLQPNYADPKHGLSEAQIETRKAITAVDDHAKITQQIVIGTPGKVKNYVVKKSRSKQPLKIDPRHIRLVVVDEADQLLEGAGNAQKGNEGRNDVNEIITAIERAHARSQTKFQTVLCSATYKPEYVSNPRLNLRSAVFSPRVVSGHYASYVGVELVY